MHGRVVPAGIKGAIPPVVRATPIGHRVVGLISTWGFIAMKRLAPAAIRSLSSSTVTVARGSACCNACWTRGYLAVRPVRTAVVTLLRGICN